MVASETLEGGDAVNTTCPWSGSRSRRRVDLYRERVVGFCNPGCRDKFEIAVRHFEPRFMPTPPGSQARQADRG